MSVLQRGDRLVVSELSRLGRSLGQITERWSGRSFGTRQTDTCGSAVAVRRFLEVLDRRLHLVRASHAGQSAWPGNRLRYEFRLQTVLHAKAKEAPGSGSTR